ncbi:tRNA lysidine(34) synthetase TilS [Pseudomonas fluorescens]|uniref:tRNA(Ile)-lysidine synthase n=1 Tax=Pseudomonas fluorescens TaxID=294 RepID=A0AAE2PUW3_PSEFL|nr:MULTISPECIES: tRNA lysidine(34) synthetase TilS [Pseudomonas fluorescens group]MBA1428676.1 tRNA lysidine(34) synthetase TilS [Pseudomonas orientalis]MBD8146895.1 tRNA lysidine(34) synthetase TilS [Pseudomonas fluorescens]MBD8175339.1 tRNA lysidine(34) synthetase TilS [Pseudomonas fluorescens]MBD8268649.1 tRNA lysidine(34) synthetase TilS [Pseudomonas fluorescens]MBD8743795.1 tRNA lysidine(34) synthetase TilS [Pseudomonas fluorescens]
MKPALPAKLLQALAPWRNAPAWHIAFSGGLDSTVLLHLLATLAKSETLPPLCAMHVHHGLQTAADAWPAHCQLVCDSLGVPLRILRVQVQPGASLERAARDARYLAFARVTGAGEVLLTGQHRDDQAETVLFRLLRGAGVRGLAAMPAQRTLAAGHLVRPLLDVERSELQAYAHDHHLKWIEDPSNADPRFSRNYLRHRVLPVLAQRWPQVVSSLTRTAEHVGEAQGLLDELAVMDRQRADQPSAFPWLPLHSLLLTPLRELSDARQRNALRHWLAPLTRLPDSDHWAGWISLRDAKGDAQPVWRLADGELHRCGERIWWLPSEWSEFSGAPVSWPDAQKNLELPGNGQLKLMGDVPGGPLEVRYRQGGEIIEVPGRGRRDLKRLFNECGVPGFVRGRLPLLYRGEQLLGVPSLAGLWATSSEHWQLDWLPQTCDQGLS